MEEVQDEKEGTERMKTGKRLAQRVSAFAVNRLQRVSRGTVTVHGMTCSLSPDVFNPKLYVTTSFFLSSLRVGAGDRVLDMGTGSGMLAVAAARRAREVVAVDINPAAAAVAARNAENNGVGKNMSVLCGDLFSPLGEEDLFDVILFNPPYLEGRIERPFDYALYDPGKGLLRRFFAEAGGHLLPSGYIQMVYSSIAGPEEAVEIALKAGFTHRLEAKKRVLFERFFVLEFRRR